MGMPVDEYWNGSPIMAKMYRKAWELRQSENNRNMWLQGLYFYTALCDVSPVLHAFARPGTHPNEYLSEPIALTNKEIHEKEERDEQRLREKHKQMMDSWMSENNSKYTERK